MFCYTCFCFLWSVCWLLPDGRFRRAEKFNLAGFVQSLTGRERGGAFCLSLVAAEGGANVQPPISRLPEKIINK